MKPTRNSNNMAEIKRGDDMSVLSKIQKELKVGKGKWNDFSKFNYRTCSDILEAVKPLLPDGYSVILNDKVILVGDRFYIEATATLNGEQSFSCTALAREPVVKKGMDEAQVTGTASSYARKYALSGLFAIDDSEDVDAKENPVEDVKTVSEIQQSTMVDLLDATQSDHKKFCMAMGIATLADLPEASYEKALGLLQKKLAKQEADKK
jgi:hypothetical protein